MAIYKTFETERLILRPTNIEDASFILELLNMPKWIKYIGDRKVHSEEEAIAYIQTRMLPQLERLGFGNYTVIRKEDNVKMGCCGLYDREGLDGVDIGFSFLPAYEKQGYAYESASKIKEIGLSIFEFETINAITLPINIDSQNLLSKLGFVFIKHLYLPNDPEELMLFSYTKKKEIVI